MNTPVEVWLAVSSIGGRLGVAGDKLRMLLPPDCPPGLKDAIRQHKPALLELLQITFWLVRSDTLKATVFWTPDESTKEALVDAGAVAASIYTVAELRQLVNRGVTAAELPLIHEAKKQFNGRLISHGP